MAKKIFLFRGKTLEELQALSVEEFAKLLPAKQRRSFSRGFTHQGKAAYDKFNAGKKLKTHAREIIILPSMVGKTISVHKGNGFSDIVVQEEMIGHRVGEFALPKKRVNHGKAGLGATSGSSATTRK